jgi:dienelactone hydrolase
MEENQPLESPSGRREFIRQSAALALSFPLLGNDSAPVKQALPMEVTKSIIGQYGPWAIGRQKGLPKLSFRNSEFKDVRKWKAAAAPEVSKYIAAPESNFTPTVRVDRSYQYDGLLIEEISWQLPYGRATKAVVLKPADATGKLPGVLALHDHGGNKYFGVRKITKVSDDQHPMMADHQTHYYEGKAWANELAKQGFVVLVHDTFTFGSRRVEYGDMSPIPWGELKTEGKSDRDPERKENIEEYNKWAGHHEHVMAKSLFCSGTTWPGVFLSEDQVALNVLAARKDVDPQNLGCGGLSGGGLRTVFLAGLDERIKCCVCVGFMSTWKDFALNKAYTHTWMTYVPILPQYLDFPEILGLRVPLPTMVLNDNQDSLYTLPEMKAADSILKDVFSKAGASDKYDCRYYEGPHKFDQAMQKDAFGWFRKWLKS